MGGQDTPKFGKRFDHLIVDLLKSHEGVFLGERHDHPSMRQSVTKLLPLFKANGVETISFEVYQPMVDGIRPGQSYADYATAGGDPCITRDAFELVQTAKQLGMKVLGHENPASLPAYQERKAKLMEAFLKQDFSDWGKDGNSAIREIPQRDAWAADYIVKNKVGKVIVIGGKGHSGNYRKADIESSYLFDISVVDDYQGLDQRLGYPSVDYEEAMIGMAGATINEGRFSDYVVGLPADLRRTVNALGITSWPPPLPGSMVGAKQLYIDVFGAVPLREQKAGRDRHDAHPADAEPREPRTPVAARKPKAIPSIR